MTSLVTVIIPVAKAHTKLLREAVKSVKSQTVSQAVDKIYVVDDTGGQLSSTPSGVVVLKTAGDEGASKARNVAIEKVKTPFLLFLDADDVLTEVALEALLRAFASYEEAAYIYGDSWTHDGLGNYLYYVAPLYNRQLLLQRNLHNITALLPTSLVHAIQGFDEVVRGWEDWDFYIRLALNGYCGTKIPCPLILYNLSSGVNRSFSGKIAPELLHDMRTRYKDYIEGRIPLMGCCPGDNAARLAAQALVNTLPPSPSDGTIMLEYMGRNEGPIPYRVNGRTYRGANNPSDKFVKVPPEDVAPLIALEVWRPVPSVVLQARRPGSAAAPQSGVTMPSQSKSTSVTRSPETDLVETKPSDTCADCGHIEAFHKTDGCVALMGEKLCGCKAYKATAESVPA